MFWLSKKLSVKPLLAFLIILTGFGFWSSSLLGYKSESENSSRFAEIEETKSIPQNKIVIAHVACSVGKDEMIYEETLVSIKSILISANNFHVGHVDFHIFLEQEQRSKYFRSKLKEYIQAKTTVIANYYFHAAVEAVPKKFLDHMIYHKRFRCGYVRSYLASALPDVDSIIYLDSDTIVTGDISRLWNLLGSMNAQQMIAIGRNNELEDTHFGETDKRLFGSIPHVPPKGVNNGVMVMNLTRLRDFGWDKKFTRLYQDYSKVTVLTVQRLTNVFLYYNPGLLKIIPCELHFIHIHCTMGLTCNRLDSDDVGIHLMHGTNHRFVNGTAFRNVYVQYKKFKMSKNDFVRDIVEPVQRSISKDVPHEPKSKCPEIFVIYLFKGHSKFLPDDTMR